MPALASSALPRMVDPVLSVSVGDETIVAPEAVRVDGGSLGNLLADDRPEHRSRDIRNWSRVLASFPLQDAEKEAHPFDGVSVQSQ